MSSDPITEGPPEPVLVVLQSARGTLEVTGSEAKGWLNGLVSCDVLKVSAGQGAFGLVLNKQGKIQSEVEVVATSDGLLLGVSPGVSEKLTAALDKFLVMEDAELKNASAAYAWADFHGTGAAVLAASAAEACGGTAAVMNFTLRGGATVVLERDRLPELQRFVERSPALGLASDADWEAFRISQVFGQFGVDFGEADNPHEAALDRRAVSWNKGCYLGQEVVCMLEMRGHVKRKLVPLSVTANAPPAKGTNVTDAAGTVLGQITSAAENPDGTLVALAMIKGAHAVGAELKVADADARVIASPS